MTGRGELQPAAGRLIADTGFLVAFGRRGDALHASADAFLRGYAGRLVTAAPVIVETCFFLRAEAKLRLFDWIGTGALTVLEVPAGNYPEIGRLIARYADRDIDFTDAALIWLADRIGIRSILTVDAGDFAIYRLAGKRRFDIVQWMSAV